MPFATIDEQITQNPWIDNVLYRSDKVAIVEQLSKPTSCRYFLFFNTDDQRSRLVAFGELTVPFINEAAKTAELDGGDPIALAEAKLALTRIIFG